MTVYTSIGQRGILVATELQDSVVHLGTIENSHS